MTDWLNGYQVNVCWRLHQTGVMKLYKDTFCHS